MITVGKIMRFGLLAVIPALAWLSVSAAADPLCNLKDPLDINCNSDLPTIGMDINSGVAEMASTSLPANFLIRATRIFSGPSQYPPTDFAAYGVVAFPDLATPSDQSRYVMICEAYMATLPNASEVHTSRMDQMVTVWPVKTDTLGDKLTLEPPSNPCEEAVNSYGELVGKRDIALAEQAGADLGDGRGPFLLAWSPGNSHGTRVASVLRADMSSVTTHDQAKRIFRRWVSDIEENPELWNRGWNIERVRTVLRIWADDMGERILAF